MANAPAAHESELLTPMPVIVVLNLKGGVGKTTVAVALGEQLASRGRSVLMIDADHQSTASELMMGEERFRRADSSRKTLHDLFAAMLDGDSLDGLPDRFVHNQASQVKELAERMACLPCSRRIDEFSTNMAKARRGHQSNNEFLARLNRMRRSFNRWCNSRYDYVIVDSPPSFALQVQFLLGAGDWHMVPSLPDALSVRGSLQLMERLKSRGYSRIKPLGLLWTMVRVQVRQHRAVIEAARRRQGKAADLPVPFDTVIANTSALAGAMNPNKTFHYASVKYPSNVRKPLLSLCDEIEKRIAASTETTG